MRFRTLLFVATAALSLAAACSAKPPASTSALKPAAAPKRMAPVSGGTLHIPALNWIERSDWTNVKTDVTPKAVGDGVVDDTAALQAAISGVTDGTVIYLPAGTYRITDTLKLKIDRDPNLGAAHRVMGVAFIGNGRDTKIVWDGAEGKDMIQESGATHSRYEGFVMDGRGKAAVGLEHFGQEGTFETEVGHRNLEFHNFTSAGILAQVPPATSEATIENCLFDKCRRGIAILNWNEYDYTIDGCEFRFCETAVEVVHGNAYVRNSHFEGSTKCDVWLNPEHGSSVRRCTSSGSKQFLDSSSPVAPVSVEDCRISGWTNPDGAIVLGGAPAVVFDTVFTKAPTKAPPIKIVDILKLRNLPGQRLFLSQCESAETDGLYTPGLGVVHQIPPGKRRGSLVSADQHFIVDTEATPSVVFDAKRDFGAAGDGKTDDTVAVQKAVDAARTHGKGAIAYLPSGVYLVNKTIKITGANYSVGGSGRHTNVLWRGPDDGVIMSIQDPRDVTLENIAVGYSNTGGESKNDKDVVQTSTGETPSLMTYDNVTVYGCYAKDPFHKGLWLQGLNSKSTVRVRRSEGNIRVVDSARAAILMNVTYEGSITVEGKGAQRDGFLGIMSHLGTICEYSLYVKDNHSLVASDFYTEQSNHGYSLEGSPDDPPGRITLAAPKLSMGYDKAETNRMSTLVKGYHGEVNLGPSLYYTVPQAMNFSQEGGGKLSTIVWASVFYDTHLVVRKEDEAQLVVAGSTGVSLELAGVKIETMASPETLAQLSFALDDLRALGVWDLRLNHPGVKTGPKH